MEKIKVGDFVRLVNGETKMEVIKVDQCIVSTVYSRPRYYNEKLELYDNLECDQKRRMNGFVLWNLKDPKCVTDYTPKLTMIRSLKSSKSENYKKEEVMTKPSLYQTKETKPRYGTFLIKNSTNQTVLEMKGENGKVESFDENDIEIVTPYTIELTALRESVSSIHVISKRSTLKKDDVLLELNSSIIYRVTKLDSKCLSPKENKSKWMKIPAEFIILGE